MFRKLIGLLAVPLLLGAQQKSMASDTTFHPISLSDAIRLASENNVSAIQAVNATRTANYGVKTAKAQLYPTLTGTASQSKRTGDVLGQSGTIVPFTSKWTYSTGLTSNLLLFDGGKTFADIRTNKANVVASQANEVLTTASLALQVKEQYNLILSANEQEAAGRAQLDLAQQELAVSIAKVNAGAANVADSLNNVVAVGTAQLAILTAQQNLRAANAQLTTLVATPYLVTATASDTSYLHLAPIDSAGVTALALQGPQIKELNAQLVSFQAARSSAKATYLPQLTAQFSYNGNGNGPYGFGADEFPYQRGIALNLQFPIFNQYQRESRISAADINLDNAQAELRNAKLTAQQTLITQIGLMRNAQEKIRVQQQSVDASLEALRVNQQRYELGAGTMVDVLTSQSNLITAREGLIQARLDYRNARATIESVIGRDLP